MLGKDKHKSLLDSAMENLTNPDEIGQYLLQASDDAQEVYTTLAQKETDIAKLQSDNKALAKLNASLYQRVGVEKQEPEEHEEASTSQVKISDLFDERGRIK